MTYSVSSGMLNATMTNLYETEELVVNLDVFISRLAISFTGNLIEARQCMLFCH